MSDSYELTRLNAVTHGILSKELVLPHESKTEYEELLSQYMTDFAPQTATERTLVEELTAIVWRKKRILKAENAKINTGLANTLRNPVRLLNISAPLLMQINEELINNDIIDVREYLAMDTEELKVKKETLQEEEQKRLEAEKVLNKGGRNCTAKALECLGVMLENLWCSDENSENNRYSLSLFLAGKAKNAIEQANKVIAHVTEIKEQALGNAVNQVNFDSFARYEAHLDRKYERTLAMLIKLRSLSVNSQKEP